MSLLSKLETVSASVGHLLRSPRESLRGLARQTDFLRGTRFARLWGTTTINERVEAVASQGENDASNPLRAYFDAVTEGPGVWKWRHYFDVYHRHLHKFVGREVTVVEVGVFGGGSLRMWRHYFCEDCSVHGVDIQEACKAYKDSHTTIHIGDQEDRVFWQQFRESTPSVDVLIDDGGHLPEQQMVTLEEMLPHLRPGGVYICEDVHRAGNGFAAFVHSLADGLNAFDPGAQHQLTSTPTPFQAAVYSIHLYPFVVVIEKRGTVLSNFSAPKHGSRWS